MQTKNTIRIVIAILLLLPVSAYAQYSLKTEMFGQTHSVDNGMGLIRLDPPGGVYAPVTVVTVTAVPSMLSSFDGWSGDLSGSSNPTTITMNRRIKV